MAVEAESVLGTMDAMVEGMVGSWIVLYLYATSEWLESEESSMFTSFNFGS